MPKFDAIYTDHAPKPIGPYSQAIQAGGFVFLSGQISINPETGAVETGTVEEQTRRVMSNIGAVLKAAGLDFHSVVKTTIFLKSMNDFPKVNEIYGKSFEGGVPPARSTVEVARLPKDVLVEIECVAVAKR